MGITCIRGVLPGARGLVSYLVASVNILTYSSLYPNAIEPAHGIFVERRLLELVNNSDIQATVVSPVPWFPFKSKIFGKYGKFSAVPKFDRRNGIDISYPRYPLIPKIGMLSAPGNMARSTESIVRRLANQRQSVDLIDAHYFYPDGVAAALIAARLGLPFIVTARGSDINTIAAMSIQRKMILRAAENASAVIAVSEALGRSLRDLGIEPNKIHVLPNGVDLQFFKPGNRDELRQRLNFNSTTFLSVGALKEAKGHDVAIRSLQHIDDAKLVIIGSGEYESNLKNLVISLGLQSRVSFAGQLQADDLLEYYQAADCLFLISRREGMPNVVLESVACGTPVVAADVGGIAEVIATRAMGTLVNDRQPRTVVAAWKTFENSGIDRTAVRSAAESHSWQETTAKLCALMERCGVASRH